MSKSTMALLIAGPLIVIGIATVLILRSVRATSELNSAITPPPATVLSGANLSLPNAQSASETHNHGLDKQAAAQPVSPSPDAGVPNLAQLRAFGEKIADGWCGGSGERDPEGHIHHHVLRDIIKNQTNSLIHPSVWTFVVDEVDDTGGHIIFNFNFYWDGHRLAASESTGLVGGDNTPNTVNIGELDGLAKKVQNQ
jgi:hypothetical protein